MTYEKEIMAKIERLVNEKENNFSWIKEFERYVNPSLELRRLAVDSFDNGSDFFWKNAHLAKKVLNVGIKEDKPYRKIIKELNSFTNKEKVTDITEYLNFIINTSTLKRYSTKEDLLELRDLSANTFCEGYCFMFNMDIIRTEKNDGTHFILEPKFDIDLMNDLLYRYKSTGKINGRGKKW
jgi:hypothetical protein